MSHHLTHTHCRRLRDSARSQEGFSLAEVVVTLSLAIFISLTALGLVSIAQSSVTRVSEQTHMDQTGRVGMEKIMQVLHSACIVPERTSVQAGSTQNKIRIISEFSEEANFPTVHLHEIEYVPAKHEIMDRIYKSEETKESQYPNWKFPSVPERIAIVATHLEPTTPYGSSESLPVFRYYRYYRENAETHEYLHAGELETTPLSGAATAEGLTSAEADETAKITAAFSIAPVQASLTSRAHLRATALEDSAVYRLTPASTEVGKPNEPCS